MNRIVTIGCLLVAACIMGCDKHSDSTEAGRTAVAVKGFDIPSSLVWRMQEAHDAARNGNLNIGATFDSAELLGLLKCGMTNAEEIAAQPRGEMGFCDDRLTPDNRKELWPFDVSAFEATLEAKMVCDGEGLFRKRAESGERLPLGDDGLVAPNPTIRWVNDEIERWAVAQLDARFTRLDGAAFREATGCESMPEGWLVWLLDDMDGVKECFVIENGEGAWNPRHYMGLVCADGRITVIASFDSFPNRREAAAMRMFGEAEAVHNRAVLEWRHRIFRLEMDPLRIRRCLEVAKRGNVPNAEANLKVLFDHIPKISIDEAP